MSIKMFIEIEVEVDYDYSPAEPMVLYPNEDAYPGCPADIYITEIKLGGKSIEYLLTSEQLDHNESMCWDNVESMNEESEV